MSDYNRDYALSVYGEKIKPVIKNNNLNEKFKGIDETYLEKLLRIIQGWPGVIRTETQIILSSNKRKQPLRIPLKGE